MPRSLAYQFPARGQFYSAADGAVTSTEPGILYAVSDTVLASLTNDHDPNNRVDAVTIASGTAVHGQTTGFTVTSGVVHFGLA